MMYLLKILLPSIFGNYLTLFFGGSSSSTSSPQTTNTSQAYDNRQALGDGAIGATTGGIVSLSDMSNRSFSDSRDMSTSINVSDSSNRSTNTTDPGALKAMEAALLANQNVARDAFSFGVASAGQGASVAADAASKAYSFATSSNATLGAGFSKLLDVGVSMFDSNLKAVQQQGQLTAQAYQTATAEKSGSLDNRTILILGVAAVAAFAFTARK